MAQISELLKSLQQGNGGSTQPQSPFQLDEPAPAAPPSGIAPRSRGTIDNPAQINYGSGWKDDMSGFSTDEVMGRHFSRPVVHSAPFGDVFGQSAPPSVGPTLANAAALPQAPSPAGVMPELRDVFGNPMVMPSVPNVAPTPVDLVPSLSDPDTRTRDLAGTGSGALIDTPSSGGFAGIEEGISEAVGSAPLGVATPAPSTPVPRADPNTGVSPTAMGAPTSGSGIGTSVVNDVNFLQEGMKQMQAPQAGGLTTVSGIPLGEFLSGAAIPEVGLRAESPLGGRGASGAAGAQALEDAGVLAGTPPRPDGTFAEPRTGTARGPDGTDRAAGALTMEQATRLAKGDRQEAARMIELEKMGRDPLTGQAPKPEEKVNAKTAFETRMDELEEGQAAAELAKTNEEIATIIAKREPKGAEKKEPKTFSANQIGELEEIMDDKGITMDEEGNLVTKSTFGFGGGKILTPDDPDYRLIAGTPVGKALLGDSDAKTSSEGAVVQMKHPDGTGRKVPAKDVEAALNSGYTRA